jgi:SAM-dependent methyltransferase
VNDPNTPAVLARTDYAEYMRRQDMAMRTDGISYEELYERQHHPKFVNTRTIPTKGSHHVPKPQYVGHQTWQKYLSGLFNKPGMRVLEVGSRVVTGSNYRSMFDKAEYIGFDFYEGPNVDIVGDAHKLSSYFNEKFDFVFSLAVFEHLYAPWVVAEEISKILKVGGHVFVETHFSHATHERPWNFFQFSDMGLKALFNRGLGFETLDAGLSNPIIGFFGEEAEQYLRFQDIPELYCHSEIFCCKARDVGNFDWRSVDPDEIVNGTRYPLPYRPD